MKKSKSTLTPKLRFPEFRKEPGWKYILVDPYLEDCSSRVLANTSLPVYSSTREGLKRQDSYFNGRELLNKNEYGVVPNGCFVYRHMSDDGLFKFNINDTGGDIAVSKEYPVFRTKDMSSLFLLNILNESPEFKQFALSQKMGGTRTRLYFKNLCGWKTLLPSLPEQQKIAECLGSLDGLIAAEGRALEALRDHKRGLMQQLFPQPSETRPRLRFPEFVESADWEQKPFGKAAAFYNGRAYKQDELLDRGKYKVLRVGNFFNNNTWYYSDLELDESKYCDNSDLLYAWSASFGPRVWQGEKVIYHYHIWKVVKRRGIDKDFLFFALENETDKMKAKSANGLGLLHITKGTIEAWETAFPDLSEQRKIAGCISSLDKLIAAQAAKIETLKTHKRGMMQQLFPAPEEQ